VILRADVMPSSSETSMAEIMPDFGMVASARRWASCTKFHSA